ncbi:hypothetical protein Sden_1922 [Shewanella denitrificans OS217]|uniref:Uncharacterized protein n=2 Tax=Shewanella TaxID=22 RepID=Q12MX1_SHEDO|nr:hypothetical protein Sden_1922 [Shewanella denitrificans OS217]
MQDSADEVRSRVHVHGGEVWFSFLNPMSRTCLLVNYEHVSFFKKGVLTSLLPSLFLAAIGTFYSLKNGASKEIELLVSIPILISYVVIIFIYIRTVLKSERIQLDYNPFIEIAKNLALRMTIRNLIKSFILMGGFVLAIFIGALVIYAKGFYIIATIIFTVVGLSLSPILLVFIALVKWTGLRQGKEKKRSHLG